MTGDKRRARWVKHQTGTFNQRLIDGGRKERDDALVQMSHQELERRIVGVRQRVDTLMQSDVPRPLVLISCENNTRKAINGSHVRKIQSDVRAASMNSWC